ncbi:MAG: hypothetical protein DLM55_02385 [Acidimicrobiales bacterium]|nr:MAG: hypothetical protein DLM55_02385 [Acidimicrobiales bacterium]
MAIETIKLLTGCGAPELGTLLVFDGLDMSFRKLRFKVSTNRPLPSFSSPCVPAPLRYALVRGGSCGLGRNQLEDTLSMDEENEISVKALRQQLVEGTAPILIDVREPQEHAAGAIAGSRLIPLSSIVSTAQVSTAQPATTQVAAAQREHTDGENAHTEQRIAQLVAPLSTEQSAVLYCEHGVRSAHALALLRQYGFSHLRHLEGGYAAWRGGAA